LGTRRNVQRRSKSDTRVTFSRQPIMASPFWHSPAQAGIRLMVRIS
jgi:hypothetical protein